MKPKRTSRGPQGRLGGGRQGTLIRNGCLIDGTGKPGHTADVLVRGDRIDGVGRLADPGDVTVIDAAGRIVYPGFIDVHSHNDWTILANPTAESTIRQGTTTEVVGNCGFSFAPTTQASLHGPQTMHRFTEIVYSSCGFGEMLERIQATGISSNLAWLVGHSSVRVAAGAYGAVLSGGCSARAWSLTKPRWLTRSFDRR